ncbi:MAG: hypothetical protein HY904_07070 [Deltaproteobacteria bacterium]|nr:hypothetical protein [Deltaproteobacteria bacterium]
MSNAPDLESILMRMGALDATRLAHARTVWARAGGWLGDTLVTLGMLTPEAIAEAIARAVGLPLADDGDVISAPRMLSRVLPAEVAQPWRVVPFAMLPEGGLAVALYDPYSLLGHAPMQQHVGARVVLHVATEPAVESARARIYPPAAPPPPPQGFGRPQSASRLAAAVPRAVTIPQGFHAPLQHVRHKTPRAITMPVMPAVGSAIRVIPRAVTLPQIPVTTIRPGMRRIADVGQAAEEILTSTSVRAMADVVLAFLCNFFPRVVVLDMLGRPPFVVGTHGFVRHGLMELEVPRGVERPYYGAIPEGPGWQLMHETLGPPRPQVMMVMPVFKGDQLRMVLYADSPAPELYEDLREVDMLVRELRTALQILNL